MKPRIKQSHPLIPHSPSSLLSGSESECADLTYAGHASLGAHRPSPGLPAVFKAQLGRLPGKLGSWASTYYRPPVFQQPNSTSSVSTSTSTSYLYLYQDHDDQIPHPWECFHPYHNPSIMSLPTNFSVDAVPQAPEDPLFGLMAAYRADTFGQKVDLGIGAYRDDNAKPWVLPVVKKVSLCS